MSEEENPSVSQTIRRLNYRIGELEELNKALTMQVTFLRTQATNAMTDLEDGEIEEAIKTLKQVAY